MGGAAGTGGAPTGGSGGGTVSDGPAACTSDGWCWVYPLPHGNYLRAIWGASPSGVWAVGDGGTLMSWNGARWETTLGDTRQSWFSLWGSSARDVWTVGRGGALQHFDGAGWSAVSIASTAQLTAVWGTGTGTIFVAVADLGDSTKEGVWRSDGGGAFAPTLGNRHITGLAGSGVNDVWAIGQGTTVHWDGSKWTDVDITGRVTVYPLLTGALVNGPTDAWVTSDDNFEPLFHYDGTGWTAVPLPPANLDSQTPAPMLGIAATGSGNSEIWMVGRGGAYSWTAATGWVLDPGVSRTWVLTSVWVAAPGEVWAAGQWGTVLHRTPDGRWTTVAGSATWSDYGNISGTASDDVWATASVRVGHFDGRAWTETPTGAPGAPPDYVTELIAIARDDVWAFGGNGTDATVDHYDGSGWSRATTIPSFIAAGVWGAAPNDIWAVSHSGATVHYDGTSWKVDPASAGVAEAIAGGSAHDVWRVADGFGALHWDGKSWTSMRAGTTADATDWLTTVCVSATGEAWTGGSGALLWRWMPGGTSWTNMGPIGSWVNACTILPDGVMWVASNPVTNSGDDFMRWDGAIFHHENSGQAGGTSAFWSTGASLANADVWSAGGGGIVRRAPPNLATTAASPVSRASIRR
jgi:hypothetical protein